MYHALIVIFLEFFSWGLVISPVITVCFIDQFTLVVIVVVVIMKMIPETFLLSVVILCFTNYLAVYLVMVAPCGLRGCKNRPAPFPGRMLYKATKPGLVLFYILACFNCIVAY